MGHQSSNNVNTPLLAEVFEELRKTLDELERADIQLKRQSAQIASLRARLISSDSRLKMWARASESPLSSEEFKKSDVDDRSPELARISTNDDLNLQFLHSSSQKADLFDGSFADVILIAPRLYGFFAGNVIMDGQLSSIGAVAVKHALRVFLWTSIRPGVALEELNGFIESAFAGFGASREISSSIGIATFDALSGELACAAWGRAVLTVIWHSEGMDQADNLGSITVSGENCSSQESVFKLKEGDRFGLFNMGEEASNLLSPSGKFSEIGADLSDHWEEIAAKIANRQYSTLHDLNFQSFVAKVLRSDLS